MQAGEDIVMNKILNHAVKAKASDVIFSVGSQPVLRRDGELEHIADTDILTADFMQTLVKFFLDEKQLEVFSKNKEMITGFSFGNQVRFRVSMFFQKNWPEISLRIIHPLTKSLKDLGLPEKVVVDLAQNDQGLILAVGPFGSGRSTTVNTIIELINQAQNKYITTLEKPIEYIFHNKQSIINQREIGRDAESFVKALKFIREESVDIVSVSQFEEKEVIEETLDVVDSGKLVFASMDSDSSVNALEKIIHTFDLDEEKKIRSALADVLNGIIVQRLLPRIGGGRILVSEILINNSAVQQIIEGDNLNKLNNILQTSREEGIISLDYKLAELVRTGEIRQEEALKQAVDKSYFRGIS